MKVFSIAKGFHYLSKRTWPELTEKERNKLRAVLLLGQTKQPLMVCQLFGISKATLYRWHNTVDPKDLSTLKEKSRRPHRVRKPLWTHEQILAVRDLRNEYPRWSKEKLTVLLQPKGVRLSASTVGRILEVRPHQAGPPRDSRPRFGRRPADGKVVRAPVRRPRNATGKEA